MSDPSDKPPPPPPGAVQPPPPSFGGPPPAQGPAKPLYRRTWFLVSAGVFVLLVLAGLAGGGDQEGDGKAAPATATTIAAETTQGEVIATQPDVVTTTAAPTMTNPPPPSGPDNCVEVEQALRDELGIDVQGAVEGPEDPQGRSRWYYSSPEGATWISASLPDGSDLGMTLPLNDAARAASDAGVDVPPDAAAFDGVDGEDGFAIESRDCAQ